jgi:hypothetical protein
MLILFCIGKTKVTTIKEYTDHIKRNYWPSVVRKWVFLLLLPKIKAMRKIVLFILGCCMLSCKDSVPTPLTAQQIVDRSIAVSGGGKLYATTDKSFRFRDREYVLEGQGNGQLLKRIFFKDSSKIIDIRSRKGFERFVDGNLAQIPDSLANAYSNSVNSVHYFAYLPYGLNDRAVNKEFLGEGTIKEKAYYMVRVTFDREGGGSDFEDTYLYWFNKSDFKLAYLAYDFHVNGGGIRFREAYNERYVGGIRFVDYNNYKPKEEGATLDSIGKWFNSGKLELLSKIILEDIRVGKTPRIN